MAPSRAPFRGCFHRHFGFEALAATEDGGDGERAAGLAEAERGVVAGDVALDLDLVPPLGVADIVDGDIVVLAPEEGRRGEALPASQHVSRRGLSLTLGHDPMLNAQSLAGDGIGPARHVARGKDAGDAGFEVLVDENAAVDLEPRALCQGKARPHADADNDEIGIDRAAVIENDPLRLDRLDAVAEMEANAMRLVQVAN